MLNVERRLAHYKHGSRIVNMGKCVNINNEGKKKELQTSEEFPGNKRKLNRALLFINNKNAL